MATERATELERTLMAENKALREALQTHKNALKNCREVLTRFLSLKDDLEGLTK